ncbi:hypothetical protein IDJ77_22300 [Mucilaginibacter sp. ZT4R22]|uniref:Phage shock protein C (PspC) family protein n=1 Tax=Mucilaginibacter pankratovii TaxID=2772110 RepID=A0ABR7WY93_9SPHI|nr:hypothetical protein [Mucilaginibacter pankratovii]MBD1366562.1 hypothetical protein [Mucilaginibacter pankratovii]
MRLFRKKERPMSARQEQVAGKIAGDILQYQRRAADYLNRKTVHLSGKARLCLLVLFCAAFGSYCLFVLIRAFH